jgi:hypothetical protein
MLRSFRVFLPHELGSSAEYTLSWVGDVVVRAIPVRKAGVNQRHEQALKESKHPVQSTQPGRKQQPQTGWRLGEADLWGHFWRRLLARGGTGRRAESWNEQDEEKAAEPAACSQPGWLAGERAPARTHGSLSAERWRMDWLTVKRRSYALRHIFPRLTEAAGPVSVRFDEQARSHSSHQYCLVGWFGSRHRSFFFAWLLSKALELSINHSFLPI